MDAFEGIHTVCISSSPPAVSTPSPGYELLVTGSKGIALYSSHAFFGKVDSSGHQQSKHSRAKKEECPVGKLIDLEAELEPGTESGEGRGDTMLQDEAEAQRREAYSVSRLRSSSIEIREKGTEFLREQLDEAQKELKLKGEECERLSHLRNQLEQELEELTASLFEEAHKMVREANVKQATAEKQLKEAQGKIDVLQAEVTALKTLVLTSTPSSPNRQLHPQLLSPGSRGHTRHKSATLTLPQLQSESPSENAHISREEKELDSMLFAEFLSWREKPSLDRSSAFLSRIYKEDIGPCLSFTCSELSHSVQNAVENNFLTIEPVALTAISTDKASTVEFGGPNGCRAPVETKCALSGMSHLCRHRIKLGDKENYYYISPSSRARITAVCNFFTYIRYIQQGLVRHDAEQMFCEVMRLRREMSVAKLGFFFADVN
ncbi:guanine nucleotide exchange factor for Rab-3A isoform X1 [Ictalurus punctatus]|uniref:Guanine nucleotide exchange factor for Rab-3A isoform X1 n=2 Tax=Ictalurus punctatus TaxID=7998 RepID=A0A9F7RJP4_ICTPU|nr:guanine nucleotide exchange factor for Rab-3A isoform X1 [Ictalurus punctatus]XP_053541492.1 guanine nucleotide exchange factor for Rab-3A isoform X1 [Ictalurus punctatus]